MRHRREHHALVAEQGFPREDRDDLGHDAEIGQGQDVDLRMPEEPEEVLVQDRRSSSLDLEYVRAEVSVGPTA